MAGGATNFVSSGSSKISWEFFDGRDTEVKECNGIGRCDRNTKICSCPFGWEFDENLGPCGKVSVNTSDWQGLGRCPGYVKYSNPSQVIDNIPNYHDRVYMSFNPNPTASIIGSWTGSTLTVTTIRSGTLSVGDFIYGNGIAAGTTISAFGTGSSSNPGTYTLSVSQQNAGTLVFLTTSTSVTNSLVTGSWTAGSNELTVNSFVSGTLDLHQFLVGTGISNGTQINSVTGVGTYVMSVVPTTTENSVTLASSGIAYINCSWSGYLFTVNVIYSGVMSVGQLISAHEILPSTYVKAQLTGPIGGIGTYLLTKSQTNLAQSPRDGNATSSGTLTASWVSGNNVLTVHSVTSGTVAVGQSLSGTNIPNAVFQGSFTYSVFVGSFSGLGSSSFTGGFNRDELTVSTMTSGSINIGQLVTGAGITDGTLIAGYISADVGVYTSTYTVSVSQTVASMSINFVYGRVTGVATGSISGTTLTITSITSGSIFIGEVLSGAGIQADTTIVAILSTGKAGKYKLSLPQPTRVGSSLAITTSSNRLTVSSVSYGVLVMGQTITGTNIPVGTTIQSFVSGTGGVGTYVMSNNPTAPSTNITIVATSAVLTVTNVVSGSLAVGQAVTGSGIIPGTTISSLGTGAGGLGTYIMSVPQTFMATNLLMNAQTAISSQLTRKYIMSSSPANAGSSVSINSISPVLKSSIDYYTWYPKDVPLVEISSRKFFIGLTSVNLLFIFLYLYVCFNS